MALHDIDAAINTKEDPFDVTAGNEAWNKNEDSYKVDTQETDASTYQADWSKWHGFYRTIPEYKANIDTETRWIIGGELIMDEATKRKTKAIKGIGIDDIRKLLYNHKRTSKICGDSYLSIARDKAGRIVNLRPIDPGTVKIIPNEKGMIVKYEQVAAKAIGDERQKTEEVLNTWQPNEMFHLANNRIADEIHGIPEVEMLQRVIKWRHQIMSVQSVVMARYAKPTYFYEVDTDEPDEMTSIGNIINTAQTKFTNVILPKGTLDNVKDVRVANQATLDPLPWINHLKKYFTMSGGVPDTVLGESRESAISSAELNYISYKERILQEQIEYSIDIKNQLGFDIKFEKPRDIAIEASNASGSMRNDKGVKGGEKIAK